ncbi:MAG: hypothetical protein K1X92_09280 [Bacteroidia bacterium]|nr:hypothetical protein [Bacteroidia bacterium]
MRVFTFLSVFVLMILLSGCTKNPEKILPAGEAKWKVSGHVRTEINQTGSGTTIVEYDRGGSAFISDNENQKMIFLTNGNVAESYTFTADEKKVRLVNMATKIVAYYDVVETTYSSQKWHGDNTLNQISGGVAQSIHTIDDIILTRE